MLRGCLGLKDSQATHPWCEVICLFNDSNESLVGVGEDNGRSFRSFLGALAPKGPHLWPPLKEIKIIADNDQMEIDWTKSP